jgi:hypothetical protein
MGVAFTIVLNSEKPGFDPKIDSSHIAMDAEKIEKILETLGLRDFDDFVSANPEEARAMLAEFGGDDDGDDAGGEDLPPEQWFMPDEGLAVIRALAKHLQANPKAVRDVNSVLRDLKSIHDVLTKAAAAGLRWHFVADFEA